MGWFKLKNDTDQSQDNYDDDDDDESDDGIMHYIVS